MSEEHDVKPVSSASPLPVPATPKPELEALQKRAQFLNVQYGVLFGASMLLLVYNWMGGRTTFTTIAWAACLGGAVLTRVIRTSLVNKINKEAKGDTVV